MRRRIIFRSYHRTRRIFGGNLLDISPDLAVDRCAIGLTADGVDQFQGSQSRPGIPSRKAKVRAWKTIEDIEAVVTSALTRLLLNTNPEKPANNRIPKQTEGPQNSTGRPERLLSPEPVIVQVILGSRPHLRR